MKKQELIENTETSIDGFGKTFRIELDSFSAYNESNSEEIEIIFEGKKFSTFCDNGNSKKSFINAIWDSIKDNPIENPKGAGRKPDPSINVTIRFKKGDHTKLIQKYGGDLTNGLRDLALSSCT